MLPTDPSMAKHGTTRNYALGCRCDDCKAAKSEYLRKQRQANRDKELEKGHKYREANRDRLREYQRGWRAANRDKRRENNRKWREANPDYHREHYKTNRDKVREVQRKYNEGNRDKIAEKSRKWRGANPERNRENDRKYYAANRDKILEKVREYRKANRDKAREHGLKAFHVRRARKLAVFIENVDPQAVFERDDWLCHICGEAVDRELKHPDPLSASLDHIIPLAKGGEHSYTNCGTAHLGCNKRKGAKVA